MGLEQRIKYTNDIANVLKVCKDLKRHRSASVLKVVTTVALTGGLLKNPEEPVETPVRTRLDWKQRLACLTERQFKVRVTYYPFNVLF